MGRIILVDGEKGGVGKSVFCRLLLHYFDEKKHEYDFVDADPNPDVFEVYGGINDIHFVVSDEASMMHSEKASNPDRLIDLALDKDVIVNLPGKVHESVKFWIDTNGLLDPEFAESTSVSFFKFFLTNGTPASFNLFEDSLLTYDGKIPHYLVKNLGLITDWEKVEQTELYKRILADHAFKTVELPGMRTADLKFIDTSKKSFSDVEGDLPILGKQRLKTFLGKGSNSIQALGVF